jgi:hypothetical protein
MITVRLLLLNHRHRPWVVGCLVPYTEYEGSLGFDFRWSCFVLRSTIFVRLRHSRGTSHRRDECGITGRQYGDGDKPKEAGDGIIEV